MCRICVRLRIFRRLTGRRKSPASNRVRARLRLHRRPDFHCPHAPSRALTLDSKKLLDSEPFLLFRSCFPAFNAHYKSDRKSDERG